MKLCLGSGPLAVFTRVFTQALIDNNFMASIRSLFASPIPKALGGAGQGMCGVGAASEGMVSQTGSGKSFVIACALGVGATTVQFF